MGINAMRTSSIDLNECIQTGITQARRIMDLEADNAELRRGKEQAQAMVKAARRDIDGTRAENAALWAFVRADDAWHSFDGAGKQLQRMFQQREEAREALRHFEKKP